MEILRQLTERQILDIREHFLRAKDQCLTPAEFEAVMHDACRMAKINTEFRLLELFNEVDVDGDGTMSWDEFTMFLISCNDPTVPKAAIGTSLDDGMVTRYTMSSHTALEVPRSVTQLLYFPRLNRLLRMSRTERSGTRIKICTNDHALTEIAEIALPESVGGLCCEYVPPVFGKVASSSIAVACNDCTLRYYEAGKSVLGSSSERGDYSHPSDGVPFASSTSASIYPLKCVKETRLLESQTVIRWSSLFDRLILGSRTGVISVLDVDSPTVFSHEKLHSLLVADMNISDDLLFTASVDPVNSIKCIDLHRSVVKYAIKDHTQGATLLGVNSRTQQIFSVGFDTVVLAHAIAMPKVKPFRLDDSTRPHRGRINCLQVIEGTPQVITADTEGLVKVWDIRMNHCVQNIAPRQEEVVCEGFVHGITAMAYLGPTRRLVACGREMCVYNYDAATNPHLADDRAASAVIYNSATHTLLTIHDRTAKLWEATTGMLRSWLKDIFPHEVTAACLVLPHERSFVVGTFHGELHVYAYILGTHQRKLRPRCRLPHADVVQLHYLEQFREYCNGYVIAAFKHEIVVVPDASDDRAPFHIRSLDAVLEATLVKSFCVCRGGFLAVGTADGRTRLVDLQTFNVMWSWGQDQLKGDVLSIVSMPLVTSLSGVVYFFADSCGNLVCAASGRPNSVNWITSWQCAAKQDNPSLADVPLQTSVSGVQPSYNVSLSTSTTLPPLGRRSTVKVLSREPSAQSLFGARPNSAVAAYFTKTPKEQIYSVIATHMALLQDARMLIVADERGTVTAWDVQELVMASMRVAARPAPSSPNSPMTPAGGPTAGGLIAAVPVPILHAQWKAHEDELTGMCVFSHLPPEQHGPRHQVIATSSLDREVRLWSSDGVCLGNISHERIQGRDLSAGMLPFVLDKPPADAWTALDTHLANAGPVFEDLVKTLDETSTFSRPQSYVRRRSSVRRRTSSDDCAPQEDGQDDGDENNTPDGGVLDEQLEIQQVLEQETNAPEESRLAIVVSSEAEPMKPAAVVPVTECLTFLTAVAPETSTKLAATSVGDDDQLQRTQVVVPQATRPLDSRALRNRLRASNASGGAATTRLSSQASPPRDILSPKSLQGASPKLIEDCFNQIRHGDGQKRPDVELLGELTPRGDNPTDLVKEGRTPRKPGPPPLWLAGIHREEECREAKVILKKLSAQAKSIGTEGERALTLSGRVVVPPAVSGAPPSARSLRWKSLT